MTLRLILTRHAKSSWDDPLMSDHDRPLNERGKAAAADLGNWLASRGYVPEEVALHQEIARIEDVLPHCTDEREKIRQLRRISCLKTRLEGRLGRSLQLGEDGEYYSRVVERLSTPRKG